MLQSLPAQCFPYTHIFLCCNTEDFKVPAHLEPGNLVIKYRSRATCEIAALQRALTSRTAAQGSPRGRPLYPEVRPLSTATTHAEAHPSLQGSPIWPNSSESALVRYDVKYPDGRRTRCGAHSQSQPRSSRGPPLCEREGVSGRFPLSTKVHASRTSWPCVVDLRSVHHFCLGCMGSLFFPSLPHSEWAIVEIRTTTNRHLMCAECNQSCVSSSRP